MLENPHILRKMVTEVGAVSTDMIGKESVDELCGKCDDYAAKWMSTANELWKSKDRYAPFTQYYRDHEVSAS